MKSGGPARAAEREGGRPAGRLVPHAPSWAPLYEAEATALVAELGDGVVAVEHVGSTSVPGLSARPIVDILVGLAAPEPTGAQLVALRRLGYRRPRRRSGRMYACKGKPRAVTLHFAQWGSPRWWRLVDFRDALRADPRRAERYESLKAGLAAESEARYAEGKRLFVEAELAGGRRR